MKVMYSLSKPRAARASRFSWLSVTNDVCLWKMFLLLSSLSWVSVGQPLRSASTPWPGRERR